MRLRGALSIPRDKILELKSDAFRELVNGLLKVTRLEYPQVQKLFAQYLESQDIYPDDKSIELWLQDNHGELVGAFMFQEGKHVEFLIRTGTQAELKQIGEHHAEKGYNPQGAPRVRQVDVGEKARIVQPRRI